MVVQPGVVTIQPNAHVIVSTHTRTLNSALVMQLGTAMHSGHYYPEDDARCSGSHYWGPGMLFPSIVRIGRPTQLPLDGAKQGPAPRASQMMDLGKLVPAQH